MLTTSPFFDTAKINNQDEQTWRPLRLYNYYRVTLAGILLLLFIFAPTHSMIGKTNNTIYYLVSMFYLLFSSFCIYSIRIKKPNFTLQLIIQVLVDISILTTIIYTSGGLASGLGILIVITIACSSLLMGGRQAIFAASVATVAILLQAVFADLNNTHSTTSYTHAGLLGIAFLFTSWVSVILSKRVRESEEKVIQHELNLANLEQLNDYIIQNFHSGILVIDQNNQVRLVNEAAKHLLNQTSIGKKQHLHSLSPELSDQVQQWQIRNRKIKSCSANSNSLFQPNVFKVDENSPEIIPKFANLSNESQSGVVIIIEDSSEVSEKIQQIKLAALGRLTASIAHEIRNPLGAISHAAQLLEESPSIEKEDSRLTQIIIDHSKRMNTIVQNILQLSRKESSHPEVIELHEWLIRFRQEFCVIKSLQESQIEIAIKPQASQIIMDSSHLHQIVSNLCENAILHSQLTKDNNRLVKIAYSTNGTESHLDIIDFGKGIDQKTANKIFEPFYTTASKGTGLGLYISRELCECNKARINYFVSDSGESCFRITFLDPSRVKL